MNMERDFASTFGSNTITTHPTEFNINSIFNDPNLQPLLPLSSESDPSIFNIFGQPQDFPSLPLEPPQLHSLYSSFSATTSAVLRPQIPDVLPDSTQFLDFFSNPLPELHSLEQPHRRLNDDSSSSVRKLKRNRGLDLNLSDNNPQTLDSIVQSFSSPSPPVPHSELARTRRQKLGEKIRCLQKLMPWYKKMDNATLLEEGYKYIRFLQAQVSVLQSMPITSSFAYTEQSAPLGFDYGGLARLNRQQLLQVLVNSPAAQTILSSKGYCVFAYEQLVSLKKAKERKTALQQFLIPETNQ